MIKLTRAEVAEAILGKVEWQTDGMGFTSCPGANLHTNPSSRRDCAVYLSGAPTIHCLHSSCRAVVDTANRQLRSEIGRLERTGQSIQLRRRSPSKDDLERRRKNEEAEKLERQAAKSLEPILRDFTADPAELWESSPVRLLDDPRDDWRLLLSLFPPDDVVWIGDMKDTGQPRHSTHFQSVSDWLKSEAAPDPLIVPSAFRPGTYSRSKANVVARRFLVVESDTLSKEKCCAVFTWCRQFMRLRAVVDTGGKSVHGWFDTPSSADEADLVRILPALGCDGALFNPAQPVRLPGHKRPEKETMQALLYLDPQGGAICL